MIPFGQTIEVPGAKYIGPTDTDVATQPAGPPGGPVKKEALPPPGQQAAAEPPRPPPAAGEPTPLSPAAATPPPPGPTPRFQWPLSGKIITPYGNAGGQKSDGIDIATTNGTPVKAADGGKVVYAGDGVPHLGNLLLVEHSAGYITAYGNIPTLSAKLRSKVSGNACYVPSITNRSDIRKLFESADLGNRRFDEFGYLLYEP